MSGLSDERREALIEAMSARLHETTDRIQGLVVGPVISADTQAVWEAADAIAPLIAGWLAAERTQGRLDVIFRNCVATMNGVRPQWFIAGVPELGDDA